MNYKTHIEVVFYDRKHRREVKASQLMRIKLGRNVVGSNEDQPNPIGPAVLDELHVSAETVGTIAYKSDKCPKYSNWDNWLNEEDLVFLRLEDLVFLRLEEVKS